jgi:hypothetical protein
VVFLSRFLSTHYSEFRTSYSFILLRTTLLLFAFPTAKTSISQKVARYARLKPLNRSGSAPLHLHWRAFKTLLHNPFQPPFAPNIPQKHLNARKESITGPAGQGRLTLQESDSY